MSAERLSESPVRLRPVSPNVFEARSGDKSVTVEVPDRPPTPPVKEEEEEIVRTNPGPTVGALLMRGDEVIARHAGELHISDPETLSTWIEAQEPAEMLVIEVSGDHVTTDQVRQLAAVASRHEVLVDVNLHSDG